MNIHPAFVHFPIALLTLYTLIELLPLAKFFPNVAWHTIKLFLLYVGTVAIFPTIVTGLLARALIGGSALIDTHKTLAFILLGIFVGASLLAFLQERSAIKNASVTIVQKILAVFGLLGLFIQGALGAAIVYGYTVDPFVSFVTSLFGFH